ncbi:uncharacterized protein LOC112681373, partial [Sipha flava]|uniref:Uncharacterized protein LOC112681373 n=1 Tax=Sipha flava TaxID=143950 RepID=A0A8B8F997_9HEMI
MVSCPICSLTVKRSQSNLTCNNCKHLFHPECVSLKKEDVDFLTSANKLWTCQNCTKSMKILQQSDFSNSPVSSQSSDKHFDSTDLKRILSSLDDVRAEQSKLFDLVNNQSKKLDVLDNKFTC